MLRKASDPNVDSENNKGIQYNYNSNYNILFDVETLQRKLVPKRDRPYKVIGVNSNRTLKLRKGVYVEIVSTGKIHSTF